MLNYLPFFTHNVPPFSLISSNSFRKAIAKPGELNFLNSVVKALIIYFCEDVRLRNGYRLKSKNQKNSMKSPVHFLIKEFISVEDLSYSVISTSENKTVIADVGKWR